MSAEQTKSRILEAAFREFAEYGVAGARVDRIAKSAACNKNLIYVYFSSKEALFASVLDRHLSEAYVGLPFTPEDLPGYARRVFDFAQANPGVYRLLAWATLERGAALPPARAREHDSTLPLILAQQESRAIQPDAPPALILMAVMALATAWSPVFPFGATANPAADLSPDTIRDTIAGMVARIVAPQAPDTAVAVPATPPAATGTSVPEPASPPR
jgi:AcrR family transcriptional regulator